jgi:tRNA(fMet)-specific endonuclease VapC
MLYMLDTNTVSYLVHKRSAKLHARLGALEDKEHPCISAITEGEMLFGIAIKPDAHRVAYAVHYTLAGLNVLPWTSDAAASYAALRAENRKLGLAVGNLDFLIAAHAIAVGAVLVTNDGALLKLTGGLVTENWADDLRAN